MAEPLGHTAIGDGAPLLAVHGAVTGGRLTFGPVAARWAETTRSAGAARRVVAVDRPGFELTPSPPTTIAEQAERLIATARDVSQGSPVDAVGCSFGGLIVLRAAQRAPEVFRSLTLVETAAIDLCPPDMVQPAAMVELARRGWADAEHDLLDAFTRTFTEVDEHLVAGLAFLLRTDDPGITLQREDLAIWEAGLDRYALGAAVGGPPPIPVLVVDGTRSHPAFRTFARCTAAALHARVSVLDGAGHAAHLHPDFPELLAEFLAESASAAADRVASS